MAEGRGRGRGPADRTSPSWAGADSEWGGGAEPARRPCSEPPRAGLGRARKPRSVPGELLVFLS